MTDDTSVPDDFSGRVRLFPLPDLVLFPYVLQPLHIFEPRYRELMADALQDDRLIAMATLKPGWEDNYDNQPPIYPVICIGRTITEEQLPDGRYNLLLHGLQRARIVEELPLDKLYRTAEVVILEDVPIASPAVENELRQKLSGHMNAWFASQSATLVQIRKMLEGDLPLGTLCDIFSFTLNIEMAVKQQLLEQVDVEQRIRQLLDYLAPRLPTKLVTSLPQPFPPNFSAN